MTYNVLMGTLNPTQRSSAIINSYNGGKCTWPWCRPRQSTHHVCPHQLCVSVSIPSAASAMPNHPFAVGRRCQAFVSSRLDYCNCLLIGITDGLMRRLQAVQNTAARLITGTRRHDHITPILRRLHWSVNVSSWSWPC